MLMSDLQKERNLGVLRQCFLGPPPHPFRPAIGTKMPPFEQVDTQWATKERKK